jgi:hypothetical protein
MFAEKSFYGSCQNCCSEGRLIVRGEGREKVEFYQCFECNQKEFNQERMRRLASNPNCISENNRALGGVRESEFWTKEEADYQKALVTYYLRPMFYKRSPDWKTLQKYSDAVLRAQVNPAQRAMLDGYIIKKQEVVEEDGMFKF